MAVGLGFECETLFFERCDDCVPRLLRDQNIVAVIGCYEEYGYSGQGQGCREIEYALPGFCAFASNLNHDIIVAADGDLFLGFGIKLVEHWDEEFLNEMTRTDN